MNQTNDKYKRAKSRKKAPPVKRVVLSADALKSYETLIRQRDERERTYGRHLSSDNTKA